MRKSKQNSKLQSFELTPTELQTVLSSAIKRCTIQNTVQLKEKSFEFSGDDCKCKNSKYGCLSAIPENREMKKMKFSFFHQRHALPTSFDIFAVTYRVTNLLPKLVDMLLFSAEKTEFPFFEFPYFWVLPCLSLPKNCPIQGNLSEKNRFQLSGDDCISRHSLFCQEQ